MQTPVPNLASQNVQPGELSVLFVPLYQGVLAFATVKHAMSKGHQVTLLRGSSHSSGALLFPFLPPGSKANAAWLVGRAPGT